MGTTMSLHLKERMKTNWLLIPRISFSRILKAWCTITDSSATSPVARLIGFSLAVNESCKYCRILKQSERSLIIRYVQYLYVDHLFWHFVPVKFCIALFTSIVTGIERNHVVHCLSLIPRLLVTPPDVFRLCIRTCSITGSGERPAQKQLLLHVTCCSFMKWLCTPEWATWIWDIIWS